MAEKPVFRPSFGNKPDQLVGRDGVVERIIEGLESYPGSAERATLIVGQRGMGKTALLLEIADRSKNIGYIPIKITCGEAMLDNLIELLQLVSISDVEMYYADAFKRASINAGYKIVGEAAEATEGFPYLIQLIGYYLTKLSANGTEADEEMLERAKKNAVEEMDMKIFQAMLNPVSALDLDFLNAMAEDEGISKISDIEKRIGCKHGTIQTYRKRLIDAGIIIAPRRGELEFTIPLLADYLKRQKQ